jgi:hypothetical protein
VGKRTQLTVWAAVIAALSSLLGGLWLVSGNLLAAVGDCGVPGNAEAGHLLIIGIFLHLFGWVIVIALLVFTVRFLRKQA